MMSTNSSESKIESGIIEQSPQNRRSLDALLSQRQQQQQQQRDGVEIAPLAGNEDGAVHAKANLNAAGEGGDFSDMPSLSSFRSSDDKSAASSSLRADLSDNMSLPSLSSFRLDDLSMASSYHSRGSAATNHLSNFSEESTAGWGSFTSENPSKSDFEDSDVEDDDGGDGDGKGTMVVNMGRSPNIPVSSACIIGSPPSAIEAKSILRNKGEGLASSIISASQISLISFGSADDPRASGSSSGILKRNSPLTTRASSLTDDASLVGHMKSVSLSSGSEEPSCQQEIQNMTTSNQNESARKHQSSAPCIPKYENGDDTSNNDSAPLKPAQRAASPNRGSLERNTSLPLSELMTPSVEKERQHGSSSASFGGGDSLPRLPRRSSTIVDDVDDSERGPNDNKEKDQAEHQDQGYNRRDKNDGNYGEEQSISDSSSSDGDLSLGILGSDDDDESADCSVETIDESDPTMPPELDHSTPQEDGQATKKVTDQEGKDDRPKNQTIVEDKMGKKTHVLGSKSSQQSLENSTPARNQPSSTDNREESGTMTTETEIDSSEEL